MPSLSAAGCLTLGCHARAVPTGRGRCQMHARQHEQQRGTSRQRGYDAEWERLRLRHLAVQPWCVVCEVAGHPRVRATDVDHLVPVRLAPERRLDPTNLRSLCHAHHSSTTASARRVVGARVMGGGRPKSLPP